MLQTLKYLIIIVTVISCFSSCKEDEYADWKILNEKWLETNASKYANDTSFFKTESGIYYKVIHQGYYRRPNLTDWVKADYSGQLIDGRKFDSGHYYRYLYEAIAGWQEGIRLMKDGAHFIFYIPSNLAYGEKGSGAIPPNSTLIFDIKLIRSGQ